MTAVLSASVHDSLAFRANLAQLISPLRRVRPRVPFVQLPAHRIPTLWFLYRGLLKQAPTDQIQFRVRMLFCRNRGLTGTEATKKQLLKGYKWLDIFTRAKQGDARLQAVLARYSSLITAKRDKEYWKQLVRNEVAWRAKLRNRPIMTGGYIRSSYSNGPLPRLKPQPLAITRIIAKRRSARGRRAERQMRITAGIDDLKREREFEEGVIAISGAEVERVFSGPEWEEWDRPLKHASALLQNSFDLEEKRQALQPSPELVAAVKQARREKVANKTRERERERRGEILPCTLKRARKGPPAHVLTRMSDLERRMDKVARRSVSEVGYVGATKRRLGWKLKDGGEGLRKEAGVREGEKERLDREMMKLRTENERRRKKAAREERGL